MTVHLEPVDFQHRERIQALAEDPVIADTTNLPTPYPPDGAETFIREAVAQREAGRQYAFAVVGEAEGVMGMCGLMSVGGEPRSAELGYWIGKPYWGRGYATAAARLALAFGFRDLDLPLVRAGCLDRNPRSRRVLEKLGFRFLCYGGHPNPKWGPEERFLYMELARDDWARDLPL